MRKFGLVLCAMALLNSPALADDNIANCEIVVQQNIIEDTGEENPAVIATYLPADNFIFSVFDTKEGHLKMAGDKKIRALMCTRSAVLPTQFDLKLIETGIPFFLSQNFDVATSALMSVHNMDGTYKYDYSGPDLNEEDIEILRSMLTSLNVKAKKETIEDYEEQIEDEKSEKEKTKEESE